MGNKTREKNVSSTQAEKWIDKILRGLHKEVRHPSLITLAVLTGLDYILYRAGWIKKSCGRILRGRVWRRYALIILFFSPL